MADLPISFIDDAVRRIRAGEITQVRRTVGLLSQCRAGDRLWLREPFHLAPEHNHLAPTQSLKLGGKIAAFAVDLKPGSLEALPAGVGRRRFARELPRALHRAHLVVTMARKERLQDITDADVVLEGARNRIDFAARWDLNNVSLKFTITGDRARWLDNPAVIVLGFRFVGRPL